MKFNFDYSSRFRILKGGKISLVVSALIGSASLAIASPSGASVTSGSATVAQSGVTTTINQATQKASINWNSFNVAKNESVVFNQPNTSAITLNRVVGNEKSIIDGSIKANGQVWILNSNGVLFGANSKINTAGLLATTADISDSDFQAGDYRFKNSSTNSVINMGSIDISDSGYATLLAKDIKNMGTITAHRGRVDLVGANEVSINLNGNSVVSLRVDKGVLDALVENKSAIYADGGEVYLTTNGVNEILKGVVNHSGIIEANSFDDVESKVVVYAHGGSTSVSGDIVAESGFVETSGESLSIDESASIIAGRWLIDPANVTVVAGAGSGIGSDTVSFITINNALNSGDVELQADNDITIDANIMWTNGHKLTLTAGDEVYVNAIIESKNGVEGGVYFNASDNLSKVIFGDNGKVVIHNVEQLQWISTAKLGKFELGSSVDASATSTWNSGAGFEPIGSSYVTRFGGTFDGKSYSIENLYINRPSSASVGLFGYASYGSKISNVSLKDATITGDDYTGAIAGQGMGEFESLSVSNSTITGHNYVGGLIGSMWGDKLENSYGNSNTVSGEDFVGGITGIIASEGGSMTAKSIFTSGTVSGRNQVGGLVGSLSLSIANSFSMATVNATGEDVGGLVGKNYAGMITYSYATGSVTGGQKVGGLVGFNYEYEWRGVTYNSSITNSYASGSVTGTTNVGGFIGLNMANSSIQNSYSVGSVTGTTNAGGFAGVNSGSILGSYYDKTVNSGMADEANYGKSTIQMQDIALYSDASWSIEKTLDGSDEYLYPTITTTDGVSKWVIFDNIKKVSYTLSGGNALRGSIARGEAITIPSASFVKTSDSSSVTPTSSIVVLDSNQNDVTAQAQAGTLSNGTYTIKATNLQSGYELDSTASSGIATFEIINPTVTYELDRVADISEGVAIKLPDVSFSGGTPSEKSIKVYDENGEDVSQKALNGTLKKGKYSIKVASISSEYTLASSGNSEVEFEVKANSEAQSVIDTIVNSAIPKIDLVQQNTIVTKAPTKGLNSEVLVKNIDTNPTQSIAQAQEVRVSSAIKNKLAIDNGSNVALVSKPLQKGEDTSKVISLEEIKDILIDNNGATKEGADTTTTGINTDVRVKLSRNSIVELVNGGVKLPNGVSQQFFVEQGDN
jgi:filamentous hemagglutinin family protein